MLKTKLNKPNATTKLVVRKGLFEKLESGSGKKLTLVSAPAGYGKSTLISQWLEAGHKAYSWFSIDKTDNDVVVFLRYIIAGIQAHKQDLCHQALRLLETNNTNSFEAAATFIINDLSEINQPFYIVLDDYHLIDEMVINNFLSFFIDNLPKHIQLVLITRSDPTIPLARLRSLQQLTEIRLADLSFGANTIHKFFKNSLNISLTSEDAKTLEKKTEGWIAGLQLAGLYLNGKENIGDHVNEIKGDNRYIMDYLMEEVLQQQSSELRDFLLFTSILDRFNASLCNYVLDISNSQELIELLDKHNLFIIPLDSERNWFRYHHLFEQLLLNRLAKASTPTSSFHHKASQWLEKHGMIEQAIQQALKTNNFDRSLELLAKIASNLYATGRHSTLVKYGMVIPDQQLFKNPEFSMYYSLVLVNSGKSPKAHPYLKAAEKEIENKLRDKPNSQELIELKGRVAVAYSILLTMSGDYEHIAEKSKIALECLTKENPLWYSWAWFAVGLKDMAMNELPTAIKSLDTALEYGKKSGNIYLVSTIALRLAFTAQRMGHYVATYDYCNKLSAYLKEQGFDELTKVDWIYSGLHTTLALVHYMWGDYDTAEENIEIGYRLSLKESNFMYQFLGLFILSFIHHGRNSKQQCFEELRKLEQLVEKKSIPPHLTTLYLTWKGFVLLETENSEKVLAFFTANKLTTESAINPYTEQAFVPYIHYLIEEGELDDALKFVAKIDALAKGIGRLERQIEVQVIYSMIYSRLDEEEKAVLCLTKAIEMASSEKIMMYFLFYADKIKDLLNASFKYLARTDHKIPKDYLQRLKVLLLKNKRSTDNQVHSAISKREVETLKLIAQGLTNQEIADLLFISIHTVKSHVKNIIMKLDVDSRHKAVIKAKELGLV